LSDVVFGFYHLTPAGEEELVYSVHLTNATITGIGQSTNPPSHSRHGQDYDVQEVEVIELTYRKIEVASPTGKTSFSDDWSASP
jgi:type VI secretion system Hcp family effector